MTAQPAVIPAPAMPAVSNPITDYERSLMEMIDRYIELGLPRAEESTRESYRAHLLRFSEWLQSHGAQQVGQIEPDHLRGYREHWRSKVETGWRKATSVNTHLAPVRGFLCWLVAEEAVFERTPKGLPWVTETRIRLWLANIGKTSKSGRKDLALSVEQASKLVNAISDTRDRALFELMLGTGLRVSEACNLRVGDLKPRDDLVLIVNVQRGKGGKARVVPLAAEKSEWVRQWCKVVGFRLGDPRDSRWLWPAIPERGESDRLDRYRVAELLTDYAREAGLERRISPHLLRHTFATHFYRETRDAAQLANYLGHANLNYVQVYVKAVEAEEARPLNPKW